ncbi:MAG: shikimate dehydrogenase [Planctomycetota bacterium]|jgi:3-dehydroquinate dehydratase/shikimate dehydrogenase
MISCKIYPKPLKTQEKNIRFDTLAFQTDLVRISCIYAVYPILALAFRTNHCYIFKIMESKLAVPIAATSLEQAKQQINAAQAAGAEMLELRTDYLDNLSVDSVEKLIAEAKAFTPSIPIIVTCRDKKEGGANNWPLKLRIDVLIDALNAGADFIDFEYENFLPAENQEKIKQALSQAPNSRLILSTHNFEDRFDDIAKLHSDISTAHPAAIPKLVYTATHINDCFEAFDFLHNTSGERIVFCMGETGLISRIIAKKLGSFVMFASIDDKSATAPGQLTIEQFKTIYRWDFINSNTELYGVIGSPIAHSLSPILHNRCFADIGANKLYLPLLVEGGEDEFDKFMDNVLSRPWLGLRSFSITIPHKQNALNFVKENQGVIEPLAEKIGAVNTIVIGANGKLYAYNTDYAGALDAITAALGIARSDLKDWPVTVIGAGGVARAIVAGLSDIGAKIKIYNRTVERGKKLAADFGCDFAPLDDLPNVVAKLLINATSIGMHPDVDATPLPQQYLKKDMVVFDTVYNPAETLLLKQAKQVGAKTIDGLSMFINQAAAQFKLFTGKNPKPDLMRKIISNRLARKKLI